MKYKFYFYNGIPTAERRSAEFADEGLVIEAHSMDSDDAAMLYAGDFISDLNEDQMEFETAIEAEDYLNDIDTSAGFAFCIAIQKNDEFIYGDSDLVDYFMRKEADDDALTEAITEHTRFNQLNSLQAEIKAVEAEIKKIESETIKMYQYQRPTSAALALLSEDERAKYNELTQKIKDAEREVEELKRQYETEETRWYRCGQYSDDVDFDVITTVHDKKLKNELEPKVLELREAIKEMNKLLWELETKAKKAYNDDALSRRAAAGYDDKVKHVADLKSSKAQLLKEIEEDPDFEEIMSMIKAEYEKTQAVDAGITEAGVYIDLDIKFDMEVDDDDFDEDGSLDLDEFEEKAKDQLVSYIPVDEVYECEDSDAVFKCELLYIEFENEPTISRSYTPGRQYLANGDPGYPDEYDFDIDSDLRVIATLRVTKIR